MELTKYPYVVRSFGQRNRIWESQTNKSVCANYIITASETTTIMAAVLASLVVGHPGGANPRPTSAIVVVSSEDFQDMIP